MIVMLGDEKVKLSNVQFEYLYWLGKSNRCTVEKHLDFKSRHRASVFHNLWLLGLVNIERVEKPQFSQYIHPKGDNERYRLNDKGANVLLLAVKQAMNVEPTRLKEKFTQMGFNTTA